MAISLAAHVCLGIILAMGQKPNLYEGKTVSDWVEALKDKDPNGRRSASVALAKARTEDLMPILPTLLGLVKDGDAYTKQLAIYVLGNTKTDPDAVVAVLVEALKDKDSGVRRDASAYLVRYADDARGSTDRIIELLKDKDPYTRLLSAYILGNISPDPLIAIPALSAASKDSVESVRKMAEDSLKKVEAQKPKKP